MPIYEYKCNYCTEIKEKLVSLKDRDKKQQCGCGSLMERIEISKSSFQLKGNWFKTTGEY